ncbi:single-stranded DNA-binding protein [Bifidobacterium mongoliense]|uniref:single-stranded DNA-binding protein n=1 Tax=Bifidobacterium mongoliense TaxID=518643 RepID=UPI0026477184|nr:single-stranded DNA-binding protein [Bifidobacterium mongoliense]MDN6025438.1 single-stranded DNA-binding protein [Bifidobacterium mongoliense]MDN6720085.1 single-stranded DNA-binding protein [Bifidobacterium mongoliense]
MATPDNIAHTTGDSQTGAGQDRPADAPDLRDCFYGFVASNPQLTQPEGGTPRLYFKAGQEHYRPEPDGTFTKLETTFHDVVAFRAAAVRGFERLAKQDYFVAQGQLDTSVDKDTGVQRTRFIASRLGHDLARTRYEVDRTPQRNGIGQEVPAREVASFQASERSSQARSNPAIGL